MGLIAFLKYAVNNTIGTSYFKPLDELLGATLVLRGAAGTTFSIVNSEGLYPEITVTLDENSQVYDGIEYVHYVPVCLGTYVVTISASNYTTDAVIEVTQLGVKYLVEYMFQLSTLTSSGTFTVPDELDVLYVDAAGGGGGGGGGGSGSSSGGGGGGGGADFVLKQKIKVVPGSSIECTVGTGGSGGTGSYQAAGTSGSAGKSTVIGDLLTLAGGKGGVKPSSASGAGTGGAGTGSGASGGAGGSGSGDGKAGGNSSNASGGEGGIVYNSKGGGGGGGASLGKGGNGAGGSGANVGDAGTLGGGGGGSPGHNQGSSSVSSIKGGKGGNGVIIFYRGVKA